MADNPNPGFAELLRAFEVIGEAVPPEANAVQWMPIDDAFVMVPLPQTDIYVRAMVFVLGGIPYPIGVASIIAEPRYRSYGSFALAAQDGELNEDAEVLDGAALMEEAQRLVAMALVGSIPMREVHRMVWAENTRLAAFLLNVGAGGDTFVMSTARTVNEYRADAGMPLLPPEGQWEPPRVEFKRSGERCTESGELAAYVEIVAPPIDVYAVEAVDFDPAFIAHCGGCGRSWPMEGVGELYRLPEHEAWTRCRP